MRSTKKLFLGLTLAAATIAPMATIVACSKSSSDTETKGTFEINQSDIRSKVRLYNTNHTGFTWDGNRADGSFSPAYMPAYPDAEDPNTSEHKAIVEKAEWGFVQNYKTAFPGFEVTLDWDSDETPGKDHKDFDGHLTVVIKSVGTETINYVVDESGNESFGTGELSSDKKTLTFKMTVDDVMTSFRNSWNVYYNNWGQFFRNQDFRDTMDRFGRTIRHDNDYESYTTEEMKDIWEETVRGENNWISYDETVLSDKVFEAAANYANAVIDTDDNVLGYNHVANEAMTPNEHQNRAVMTMDGGPVPDADRLTMVMNNFGSNYQSQGHIYVVNEGQYGVVPNDIIFAEGADANNKYLKAVEPDASESREVQAIYDTVHKMVTDDSTALSNKAALLLMAGDLTISDEELFIATGFAYGTIDADRAHMLGEEIEDMTEKVTIEGTEYEVEKYKSISIAGRSHGMSATLDTITRGRDNEEFIDLLDVAFAEKNTMFPSFINGGSTGFHTGRGATPLVTKTGAADSADGIDWNGATTADRSDTDVFYNYENQPRPSLTYFNQNLDVNEMDNYLEGVDFDQAAYTGGIPALDSDAVYRPYNLGIDFETRTTTWDINDERMNGQLTEDGWSDEYVVNDNMTAMTRRFVHYVFGHKDTIDNAFDKGNYLSDFLVEGLYIEINDRDPNIGTPWLEEMEWAESLSLNYEARDDRPNIFWYNNQDDNAARGQHHDQAPTWEYGPIFGTDWIFN